MKLFFVATLFCAFVVLVTGTATGANADRMKRGLSPLSPRTIYNPTAIEAAKRNSPSGKPVKCVLGPLQCCETFTDTSDPLAKLILGLLGLIFHEKETCGLQCTPYTGVCKFEVLCCSDTSHGGSIVLGCSKFTV
ncbi:hypothetical protein PUNSTDRAFT_132225 [Punctularia strigosozonata HHB-11173 SS5]|uniref:uncharacterized protein n=1 Tax=Punctularia strigosozonata (strain HHB-11173) TaxID=741275 RepID=UPI000441843C|nr:uncharacterized protein PUNSTDRAFT_132225 [Punctularia strigosozonata HHB-11173 SS5]EIN12095.1 hypothetical protein PUNSTDRAFT_132225 [Punctularia strigosozonata HHB-11173 SS5]